MGRDTLEQRQAEVRFLEEHQQRNTEAIAAEEKALAALHSRSAESLNHEGSGIRFTPAKAALGPAENKALRGPSENKTANALTGVDFASDAAAEAAIKTGLTAADFSGRKPSGARGFTAADVREIAG